MGRGKATSVAGTTAALNPGPQQHGPGLGEGWGLLPLAEGLRKAGKGRCGQQGWLSWGWLSPGSQLASFHQRHGLQLRGEKSAATS